MRDWSKWAIAGVAYVVSGVSHGILALFGSVVDPTNVHLTPRGVLTVAGLSALFSLCTYLSKSPVADVAPNP